MLGVDVSESISYDTKGLGLDRYTFVLAWGPSNRLPDEDVSMTVIRRGNLSPTLFRLLPMIQNSCGGSTLHVVLCNQC